jgi:hypothetical protein
VYAKLLAITVLDDMDEEKGWLLQAHLGSLLEGIISGHLDREAFEIFTSRFELELTNRGLLDADGNLNGVSARAELIWNCFVRSAINAAAEPHPVAGTPLALSDTRYPDRDYCNTDLITVSQIEFQDDVVRLGAQLLGKDHLERVTRHDIARQAKNRARLAEVVECINAGIPSRSTAYLKGTAECVVWLTPLDGRVPTLLSTVDADGVVQGATDELRNLLGLWMEDGLSPRPLAAFYVRCSSGLRAPNVITASGYVRFRHRPVSSVPEAPNAGLTFNLDQSRARTFPGCCELVAAQIVLGQVTNVRLCGQPSTFDYSRDSELKRHRDYAEIARGGRSWREVVDSLEAHL